MGQQFLIRDLIECVEREIANRKARAHLARHRRHGAPTPKTLREIAMMQAIRELLLEMEKAELLIV